MLMTVAVTVSMLLETVRRLITMIMPTSRNQMPAITGNHDGSIECNRELNRSVMLEEAHRVNEGGWGLRLLKSSSHMQQICRNALPCQPSGSLKSRKLLPSTLLTPKQALQRPFRTMRVTSPNSEMEGCQPLWQWNVFHLLSWLAVQVESIWPLLCGSSCGLFPLNRGLASPSWSGCRCQRRGKSAFTALYSAACWAEYPALRFSSDKIAPSQGLVLRWVVLKASPIATFLAWQRDCTRGYLVRTMHFLTGKNGSD